MSLLPLWDWLAKTLLSQTIQKSRWLLPAIEASHLIGYALLIGTMVTVNLRVFGLGIRQQTAPQIARQLAPWTALGLGLSLITGALLFSSDPMKFYSNGAFPFKISFVAAAVTFHFTVHRRAMAASTNLKLVAACSLALWLGVVLAGLSFVLL